MLADEIVRSDFFHTFGSKDATKKMYDGLAAAHKFVFEGRTVDAAWGISQRKPSNLLDCMSWARLPFSQIWIEFPWPGPRERPRMERYITKVGLLFNGVPTIDTAGSDAGTISIFYKASDGEIGFLSYHLLYDWTGSYGLRNEQVTLYRKNAIELCAIIAQNASQSGILSNVEQDAYVRLYLDYFGIHLNPLIDPKKMGWDDLTNEQLQFGLETDRATATVCANLSLAFVLLLNCRSGVTVEKRNVDKINKRRSQRKFRPYFEHRTVTLQIFKQKKIHVGNDSRDPSRAHWVMGHFKRLATGVFWWSPHVRGDSSIGWIEKNYEVKA